MNNFRLCIACIFMFTITSANAETAILTFEQAQKLAPRVSGDITTQDQPAPPDLNTPEGRLDFATRRLGQGFDFWKYEPIANPCVSFPPEFIQPVPATPGVSNPKNWSNIEDVHTFSSESSSQSKTAKLSLTYKAFSLGASHAASKSNSISSYSSYISVDKGLVGDSANLLPLPGKESSIVLSKLAKDALVKGPSEFARLCGQGYVSSVSLGAHVIGTLDFTTKLTATASQNSTEVSAGVTGIVNGSFSTADQFATLSTKTSLKYSVFGGPPEDPDQTKWLPTIRQFGADGNFNYSNQAVIIEYTSYKSVADPILSDFVSVDDEAQGTVVKFRDDFMDQLQMLSDLEFAKSNIASFKGTKPDDIDTEIQSVSSYLDAAGKVYEGCSAAIDKPSVQACVKAADVLKTPTGITKPVLSP